MKDETSQHKAIIHFRSDVMRIHQKCYEKCSKLCRCYCMYCVVNTFPCSIIVIVSFILIYSFTFCTIAFFPFYLNHFVSFFFHHSCLLLLLYFAQYYLSCVNMFLFYHYLSTRYYHSSLCNIYISLGTRCHINHNIYIVDLLRQKSYQ